MCRAACQTPRAEHRVPNGTAPAASVESARDLVVPDIASGVADLSNASAVWFSGTIRLL
jgi:hypothetical protein